MAQGTITVETLEGFDSLTILDEPTLETTKTELNTLQAPGAMLRGLDKLNGEVVDIPLQNGFSVRFGGLRIDLADCRYPEDNPAGEAYAFLTVYENDDLIDPFFQGWMIASSPALSAMDHARFDVWVLHCNTSS
jgi:hypothetical protein